jgi:putative transcriptional regulator
MSTLEGQFLVAMPGMDDERFTDTVIYLFGHTSDGAMGLVVNQALPDMNLGAILDQIEVGDPDMIARLPDSIRERPVLRGGPVERARGFVLHTGDYSSANTYPSSTGVGVTATLDILTAMAFGPQPKASLLALGCCGWAPGQLDKEILENTWLTLPFSSEILFDLPLEERYEAALASLHITRASLSQEAGHA